MVRYLSLKAYLRATDTAPLYNLPNHRNFASMTAYTIGMRFCTKYASLRTLVLDERISVMCLDNILSDIIITRESCNDLIACTHSMFYLQTYTEVYARLLGQSGSGSSSTWVQSTNEQTEQAAHCRILSATRNCNDMYCMVCNVPLSPFLESYSFPHPNPPVCPLVEIDIVRARFCELHYEHVDMYPVCPIVDIDIALARFCKLYYEHVDMYINYYIEGTPPNAHMYFIVCIDMDWSFACKLLPEHTVTYTGPPCRGSYVLEETYFPHTVFVNDKNVRCNSTLEVKPCYRYVIVVPQHVVTINVWYRVWMHHYVACCHRKHPNVMTNIPDIVFHIYCPSKQMYSMPEIIRQMMNLCTGIVNVCAFDIPAAYVSYHILTDDVLTYIPVNLRNGIGIMYMNDRQLQATNESHKSYTPPRASKHINVGAITNKSPHLRVDVLSAVHTEITGQDLLYDNKYYVIVFVNMCKSQWLPWESAKLTLCYLDEHGGHLMLVLCVLMVDIVGSVRLCLCCILVVIHLKYHEKRRFTKTTYIFME